MQTNDYIPFHLPSIGPEEIEDVIRTLKSGWLTTGPRTAEFEREFAAYVRAEHALAVNSCTAGLHLALKALNIGPGDEVITTPMTFCATVNVIRHVGATPVLADIDDSGNIDPELVADRITPQTRGIIPVHMAGFPCRMDEIWSIARKHGLYVIEDAAHAVGTQYSGRFIGDTRDLTRRSTVVSYSFYATKSLSTGEGGMVTTADPALHERMRVLCLHGISAHAWNRYGKGGKWRYDVLESGFKYNLTDIQSSLGIHQLRKQEGFINRRTEIARRYSNAFAAIRELEVPVDNPLHRHAWHLYILRLRPDQLRMDRDEVITALAERGIGCSVHFIPIPLHTAYADLASQPHNQCPRACALFERIISLPIYPALSDHDVQHVIDSVISVVQGAASNHTVTISI